MIEDPATIRVLHREETFNDSAVGEIANERARCFCRLQFGRCRKKDCLHCDINKRYERMMSQLSEYDRSRISTRVSDMYNSMRRQPEAWMTADGLKKYYLRMFLVPLLIVFLLLCAPMCVAKEYDMSNNTDKRIKEVLVVTHEAVCDINEDGVVNCVDWAITFKKVWDSKYNERSCEIVRNNNRVKEWHHMFVIVKGYDMSGLDKWFYVEPSAYMDEYNMEDFWGGDYNPYFNIYNETDIWLRKARR